MFELRGCRSPKLCTDGRSQKWQALPNGMQTWVHNQIKGRCKCLEMVLEKAKPYKELQL